MADVLNGKSGLNINSSQNYFFTSQDYHGLTFLDVVVLRHVGRLSEKCGKNMNSLVKVERYSREGRFAC